MCANIEERLREERGIYCGGGIPVLDCFAGGGCRVWDSTVLCLLDDAHGRVGYQGSKIEVFGGAYWSSG